MWHFINAAATGDITQCAADTGVPVHGGPRTGTTELQLEELASLAVVVAAYLPARRWAGTSIRRRRS